MRKAIAASLPALGLVVLAHREHSRARAQYAWTAAMHSEATTLFLAAAADAEDARALVGEWQASEFTAANPDTGDGT
jgi:hypothetical protein